MSKKSIEVASVSEQREGVYWVGIVQHYLVHEILNDLGHRGKTTDLTKDEAERIAGEINKEAAQRKLNLKK